jgi:hypothetical protein
MWTRCTTVINLKCFFQVVCRLCNHISLYTRIAYDQTCSIVLTKYVINNWAIPSINSPSLTKNVLKCFDERTWCNFLHACEIVAMITSHKSLLSSLNDRNVFDNNKHFAYILSDCSLYFILQHHHT